jgi:hypothetical protein
MRTLFLFLTCSFISLQLAGQRMNVALSLTHIFEADHSHDGPFGYAGLGLNFRVF